MLVASISAFQADGASSSLVSCSIPFNGIVHIILRAVQQIFIRKLFLLKKDDAILIALFTAHEELSKCKCDDGALENYHRQFENDNVQ